MQFSMPHNTLYVNLHPNWNGILLEKCYRLNHLFLSLIDDIFEQTGNGLLKME